MGFFLLPVIMVIDYIIVGVVVKTMWHWFVVPTFNLPDLNIPEAIGLTIIVGFLTHHRRETPSEERDFIEKLIASQIDFVIYVVFAMSAAWVVSWFM